MQNVQHFCTLKGVKPTVACVESGAGRNFITYAKRGQTLSVPKVQKLATYLGVSIGQLLGEPEPEKNESGPASISAAEAALDTEINDRLAQLTQEELALVDAFVKGLLAGH